MARPLASASTSIKSFTSFTSIAAVLYFGTQLLACGASVADPATTTEPVLGCGTANPTAPETCAAAIDLAEPSAVLTQLQSARWDTVSADTPTLLHATTDLRFGKAMDLDASSLTLCPSTVFHCEKTAFRLHTPIVGVTCATAGATGGAHAPTCAVLHVEAGVVLRFRTILEDHHPGGVGPIAEVVAPCATPCAANETRCSASSLCFYSGREYCTHCQGKEPRVCACQTASCGKAADETFCGFDESPDQTNGTGLCSAGYCRTDI